MAVTLEDLERLYDHKKNQKERYRLADLELNGDPEDYERLGDEIERRPIGTLTRGIRCS